MPIPAGTAFRIKTGSIIAVITNSLFPTSAGFIFGGVATVQYDDGTIDYLRFPDTAIGGGQVILSTAPVTQNGWVVNVAPALTLSPYLPPQNSIHVQVVIASSPITGQGNAQVGVIASGWHGTQQALILGNYTDDDRWACWVFQGTVASDATVGTHTCSLTVTGLAGSEMEVLYGSIALNGVLSLNAEIDITDGTNVLWRQNASAAASYMIGAPGKGDGGYFTFPLPQPPVRVAGTMSIILTAQTSTVSQTQTFTLVCRIRRSLPTAVLADSTGTPVLTTNTSKVF